MVRYIVLLWLVFAFSACNSWVEKDKNTGYGDSLRTNQLMRLHITHFHKKIYPDSVFVLSVVARTVDSLAKITWEKNGVDSFIYYTENEKEIQIKLTWGNLFSPKSRHLLVKSTFRGWGYFMVYSLANKETKPMIYTDILGIESPKDSITDINGDKVPDLLINFYGSCGCCLKDHFFVFLYDEAKERFIDNINY
jgi:hypothetical protein